MVSPDDNDAASVSFRECPQATFEVYVEVARLGPHSSGKCPAIFGSSTWVCPLLGYLGLSSRFVDVGTWTG